MRIFKNSTSKQATPAWADYPRDNRIVGYHVPHGTRKILGDAFWRTVRNFGIWKRYPEDWPRKDGELLGFWDLGAYGRLKKEAPELDHYGIYVIYWARGRGWQTVTHH